MKIVFETNKVCIYDDKILIKRRKSVILKKEDIKEIFYAKWNIKNYLSLPRSMTPGTVYIMLSNPSFFIKWYCFRMKYEDAKKILNKIPEKLCSRIIIEE